MNDQRPAVVQNADDSYESTRAVARTVNNATAVPAPLAYDLLGNLKGVAYALSEVGNSLGPGLRRSLEFYDVYDNNRAPADSITMAQAALEQAAQHLAKAGDLLSEAQTAINLQGYNPAPD
jgi:hypothetical protein